jgi:hypothetical protein
VPEPRRTALRTTALPTALDTTKPARAAGGSRRLLEKQMNDNRAPATPPTAANRRGEVGATPHTLRRRPARLPGHSWPASRRLRPTAWRGPWCGGGEDGTAGPGAHPQPEAVGLGTPAVVRLVGALAHVKTPSSTTTSVEDNVQGHQGCETPLYQNAAEQPLDPTQGSDAGQL